MQGPTWPYVAFEAYRSAAQRAAVTAAVEPFAPAVAAQRRRHEALFEEECARVSAAYAAALAGDARAFEGAVAALHPAPAHRLATVALLRALAKKMLDADPAVPGTPQAHFGGYHTTSRDL